MKEIKIDNIILLSGKNQKLKKHYEIKIISFIINTRTHLLEEDILKCFNDFFNTPLTIMKLSYEIVVLPSHFCGSFMAGE